MLVRQRPGTASGICFITIEDETSSANLVVFQKLFDRYRKEILHSRLLMVEGTLQKEGEVIHIIVKSCHNLSGLLRELTEVKGEERALSTLSRADEKDGDPLSPQLRQEQIKQLVQGEIFPAGRNFR